jgi:cellulose synthase operon protein C
MLRRLSIGIAIGGLLWLCACTATPEQRAAEHMKKAEQALAAKDYQQAIFEYQVAAAAVPRDAEALYRMGLAYEEGGSPAMAALTYQKTLTRQENHEEARRHLAMLQVSSANAYPADLERASQTLRQYLSRHPENGEVAGSLALVESRLQRPEASLEFLATALRLKGSDLSLPSGLVARYAAQGDMTSAGQVVKLVERQLPDSAEAAVLAAQLAAAARQERVAETKLQQALERKADFGPALEMLTRKRLAERDLEGAAQYARALSRLPEKKWWTAYGRLLFGARRVEAGMAEFERVLAGRAGDADVRVEYAALLQTSGKKREAATLVDAILKADARNPAALAHRVSIRLENGEAAAAARDLHTLQSRGLASPSLSYLEARVAAALGNPERQVAALHETLRLNPRTLPARLDLAEALLRTGKHAEAAALLDDASPAERKAAEFAYQRNAAWMANGQWAEARAGVDAALAQARLPGFLRQDALLRGRGNDLPSARRSLQEALSLAPGDPATLELLGELLRRQGEAPAVLALYTKAAAQEPGSAALQILLGQERARQGDASGARMAFEAAASGAPRDAGLAIALLDIDASAFDAARTRLLSLVRERDTVRARELLAQIECRPGAPAPEAAVPHYLAALKLQPDNAAVLNNMAILMGRLGKFDDGALWAERALKAAPASPAVLDTAGWIEYHRGRIAAALPYLRKSLDLFDRPTARYHLAAALAKAGDRQAARREFETAFRQDPQHPERASIASLIER